ncbi:hypothetical protein [Crocinitomix catalasitica]|uniref:hypothetical protein n=1 Tax=Crocinitomix catalasitica TaxID=184607 RepID=UPI0004852622|nr:hypothetical protein [Crocinitomix catalasitica]
MRDTHHNFEQLIDDYLAKKINGEIDLTTIKTELKEVHLLDEDKVSEIVKIIADEEILALQNGAVPNNFKILSRLTPYLFIGVGIMFIAVAIYFLIEKRELGLNKFLPYIIILGGVYMIWKYLRRLLGK